jgi:hypothetical protein
MSTRSASLPNTSSSRLDDIKTVPLSIRILERKKQHVDPIDRVRGEFAEMRGFSPTLPQAARLFNLPVDECAEVLMSLVREGSLRRGDDGRYRLQQS